MAITERQKGVEVYITINGVRAKEHEDALDDTAHEIPDHTVLRYIEAVSDANFGIVVKVLPSYKLKASLEFRIKIDKHNMSVSPLYVATAGRRETWKRKVDGKQGIDAGGKLWKRPFRFAKIDLVDAQDENRVRRDARAAAHLGELRISVFRKQLLHQTRAETGGGGDGPGLQIAEKAVKGKALSHGTAFEKQVAIRRKMTFYETKPARGNDSPVAVFIFRYRSRETLQQLKIMPRLPTPDILDSFSREELRAMARERRFGKQEEKVRVKRERSAGGEDDGGRKFTNDDEVLTIDITGDEEVETREPKRAKTVVDLTEE